MSASPGDPQTSASAKAYQAIKNRLFIFRLALSVLFYLGLLTTGAGRWLKCGLILLREDFFSLNALYVAALGVFSFILFLPLEFYQGFVLEHRFRLSRQRFFAWARDLVKRSALSFLVTLAAVEGIYFFLSEFPRTWWLGAALFWFFLSGVLARIFPRVILPLFFSPKPLAAGPVRDKIAALAGRLGVRLQEIWVLDFSKKTVKANAMVAGFGASKRVFVADTLLAEFPAPEIEAVVAHELGHYLRHDVLKLLAATLVFALVSFFLAEVALEALLPVFGLQGPSDIAGLPLLALLLMAIGLVLLPAQNGFSRFLEKQADLFALKAVPDPDAFIAAMRRLGERNLSEFSPAPLIEVFLYDHPPLAKRIAMAEEFKKGLLRS
jgi:STE24 endopeptidase